MRRANLVLFLAVTFTFIISVVIVPFSIERQTGNGAPFVIDSLGDHYVQFNTDIPDWLRTVNGFPMNIDDGIIRINRPVYLAVASVIPRLIHVMQTFPDLRTGLTGEMGSSVVMLGMILLNYIFLNMLVMLYFIWLCRYFTWRVSFVSALFLALSNEVLALAMRPSPEIAGLLVTLLIVYLFDVHLLQDHNPSWAKITTVSFVFGLLLLAKGHYHAMFFIWLWAIYVQRWRLLVGTFAIHLLPLLMWIVFLSLIGTSYYNHETTVYRQVVWVLDYVRDGDILGIMPNALAHIGTAFYTIPYTFTFPALFLAAWAYTSHGNLGEQGRRLTILGLLSLIAFFILIQRAPSYLVFDMYIFIYPLVALSLMSLTDWIAQKRQIRSSYIVAAYLVVETFIGWYYLAFGDNFNWVF